MGAPQFGHVINRLSVAYPNRFMDRAFRRSDATCHLQRRHSPLLAEARKYAVYPGCTALEDHRSRMHSTNTRIRMRKDHTSTHTCPDRDSHTHRDCSNTRSEEHTSELQS